MRWYALDVDYEMAGKDLIDSVKLSGNIVRALGGTPPEGFNYELFLDEKGQKISKSKGNGLTIDEWLTYASPESLSLFMFQKPREAKRLYFDVIPRAVDDYLQLPRRLSAAGRKAAARQSGLAHPCRRSAGARSAASSRRGRRGRASLSPCCSISRPSPIAKNRRFSGASSAAMRPTSRRRPIRSSTNCSATRCAYYRDFVRPAKTYRLADEVEREALRKLADALAGLPERERRSRADAALRRRAADSALPGSRRRRARRRERPGVSNEWFNMLYQVLLGEEPRPRFGSFVALYGIAETRP